MALELDASLLESLEVDELHAQVPGDKVRDGVGHLDALVVRHAGGLVLHACELGDDCLNRHAMLKRHGHHDGDAVEKSGEGRTLLGHADEDLPRSVVRVHADGEEALLPRDLES